MAQSNPVRKELAFKGLQELSPPEKKTEYFRRLASGWDPEKYSTYRRLWVEVGEKHLVTDYPLEILFFNTGRCNLKCPMCYTQYDSYKAHRDMSDLSWDTYKKIIDEVAGKIYSIRMTARGEPTLHARMADFISYAKSHDIPEFSLISNGSRLEMKYLKTLLDAGLDWLVISVDGLDEEYETVRHPLKFADTLGKLRALAEHKEKDGLLKPVVKVQGLWPSVKKDPEKYYNTLEPYADLIELIPEVNYNPITDQDVIMDDLCCPQLWQRMVVEQNGKALPCCTSPDSSFNVLGDLAVQGVREIWHGTRLQALRAAHVRHGGYKRIPMCRDCCMSRQTEFRESFVVNGRTIYVEDYIKGK